MSDWRQSTPLGRPVVPPVQTISRSSGDGVTLSSTFPCASASSRGDRAGQVGVPVLHVVDRQQQVRTVRRQHVGELAPSDLLDR